MQSVKYSVGKSDKYSRNFSRSIFQKFPKPFCIKRRRSVKGKKILFTFFLPIKNGAWAMGAFLKSCKNFTGARTSFEQLFFACSKKSILPPKMLFLGQAPVLHSNKTETRPFWRCLYKWLCCSCCFLLTARRRPDYLLDFLVFSMIKNWYKKELFEVCGLEKMVAY